VPDDGSLAAEQLSGREIVTKAMELLRANYVFPDEAERELGLRVLDSSPSGPVQVLL
jgi:hypothetical protein